MSDRELLEKAAKAAGYDYYHPGDGFYACWNPLADDGDAFRLAVRLGMFGDSGMTFQFMEAVDCGSARRAIVRAAAALAGEAGQ